MCLALLLLGVLLQHFDLLLEFTQHIFGDLVDGTRCRYPQRHHQVHNSCNALTVAGARPLGDPCRFDAELLELLPRVFGVNHVDPFRLGPGRDAYTRAVDTGTALGGKGGAFELLFQGTAVALGELLRSMSSHAHHRGLDDLQGHIDPVTG